MLIIKLNYEEFHVIVRALHATLGINSFGRLPFRLMAICTSSGCRAWVTTTKPLNELPLSEMAAEVEFELDLSEWETIASNLEQALSKRLLTDIEDYIAYRILLRVTDEGVLQGMLPAA
jgi:hypothetical protein